MKIGIVVPNIKMTERQLEERRAFLIKNAQRGTELVMIKLEKGPISIESSLEHEQAGYFMATKVRELEKKGYDAFMIKGTGKDSGTLYRVLIGKSEDRKESVKLAARLRDEEKIKAVIYTE